MVICQGFRSNPNFASSFIHSWMQSWRLQKMEQLYAEWDSLPSVGLVTWLRLQDKYLFILFFFWVWKPNMILQRYVGHSSHLFTTEIFASQLCTLIERQTSQLPKEHIWQTRTLISWVLLPQERMWVWIEHLQLLLPKKKKKFIQVITFVYIKLPIFRNFLCYNFN